MEQKHRENEEYIARKNAEIAELEKEHRELKARLQALQLKTEEKKAQDLKSEIADMKKLIISNQKSAEESIAALGEQMQLHRNISVEPLECTLMKNVEWKDDGKPTILVLGGYKSRKMHLLNRDRTRWSTLSLNLPTSIDGAVYLDGEIYIFGGQNSVKKTYKLNREMKWIQLADMNEERRNITNSSVAFDGCIWVFGGWNRSGNKTNSVEKYIPEVNKWIQMPSMKEKRQLAAAAACKGKLFVSGGYWALKSMECFDPASQKWTMFLDLPSPMVRHAMISDGICLTVLGGRGGGGKSVWKLNQNEENATWKKLPQMRESRYCFTSNLLGDNIFAIGREESSKNMEVFNGETWEDGPELPKGNSLMCSIVIPAHLAAALSSHQ